MSDKNIDAKMLVSQGVEISSAAGRVCFGLGMRLAGFASDPKKVASTLLDVGDQFEELADACRKLASDMCDFDEKHSSRIIIPSSKVVS